MESVHDAAQGTAKSTGGDPMVVADAPHQSDRRVHIGGFKADISEADVHARFSSFGTVSDVCVGRDDEGRPRGFLHFTLRAKDDAAWARMLSSYNGATWRGGRLCIEPAKRLARGVPVASVGGKTASAKGSREEKPRRRLVRHAAVMEPVRDDALRRGWKRSRYGRAVLCARVRRPDGRIVTVDPDHHRERYVKLFGSVRPLPLSELTWSYDGNGSAERRPDVESGSSDSEDDSDCGICIVSSGVARGPADRSENEKSVQAERAAPIAADLDDYTTEFSAHEEEGHGVIADDGYTGLILNMDEGGGDAVADALRAMSAQPAKPIVPRFYRKPRKGDRA